MSLSVEIKRFKTIKVKFPKYTRVEFRGLPKCSNIQTQTDEYLEINERFQWDLGDNPLNPGETLVVHLIQHTRWNTEKVLGVYRLGLQVLAKDRVLEITDALVSDVTNQSTMVFVEMKVYYDPADDSPRAARRIADFVNKKPSLASIPSVHTSKNAPSGNQDLNVKTSSAHQPTRSSAVRQTFASRREHTVSQAPTSQQGLKSPLPQSAIESPTSSTGANSLLPLAHTSPKLQKLSSSISQKGDISSMPITHTSPKSRQTLTSPTRQGLTSPASRNSSTEEIPMTHRSPTTQKAVVSPPSHQVVTSSTSQQTMTSPISRQTITSPQETYQQTSISFPSNFHQALMTKYAKNEKAQLPGMHKSTSSLCSQQGSRQSSPRESVRESGQSSAVQSDGETDPLIHVERNIATLEQSLKSKDAVIDIDSDNENRISRGYKIKQAGKRLFKRHWSFGETSAESEVNYMPASGFAPKHKYKKASPLRSVKNLMRLGKSRNQDSSGDEEMGLLDVAAGTSAPDITTSQTSVSSEEAVLVDIRSPPQTPRITKKMRPNLTEPAHPMAHKAADFQVCVTIIEARQLAGLNMDPVVAVQVGDSKKNTSVKESTNCPYYNEYFVFDFHMPQVMLLDKIITLSVQQSRHMFRSNKLLGSFKLDVATVWNQPDRQFYHKWALLTDPDDIAAGPKGYLKCDISVIGKGDQIKVPPRSEKDEDDIEANLLVPDGLSLEHQRARFIVRIHKADGLPKMNYSLMANVKRAITGESQDLVDPYVEVSYAGMSGQTTVRKNSNCPVWNEQIIFTEVFPPLCQRIKIQLKDHAINHQNSNVIGTHFIDLRTISHDGDKGFLPTFGPAYIYLYGSTRDYSLIDQHSSLNDGMGEGVSYRGRILVSVRTEVLDILECPQSNEVELDCLPPITDSALGKKEDFFLFGSIYEANMIDKRLVDKPLSFELSIGNSGNNLDGYMDTMKNPKDYLVDDINELKEDTGFWHSTTLSRSAATNDKMHYYLPLWNHKPCMQIRSIWLDHRRRMYNSNMIANIIEKLEEGLLDTKIAVSNEQYDASMLILKLALETASNACSSYVRHMTNAPPLGDTKLDREKQRLCINELGRLSVLTNNLKALITKNSMKERLRTAHTILNKLRHLCEDAQHSMPDVFIWMLSNGKRLAYYRIPARDIIYSDVLNETGKYCAKMQTLFLKWPGKKAAAPSGWIIPAKISVYLWLGTVHDKGHYSDGLPPGYEVTNELKNAGLRQSIAPHNIIYGEKHKFQMRAYIYQARSLIGSDSSGLSDPFARVIIGDETQKTQVIDQTLSPTWDETLVFENITLYSTIENIKADPPTVVIEIFDQDGVGKSEFIGRTLVKPIIKALEDLRNRPPCLPALEWHKIRRGDDKAGELLATFELLEFVDGQNREELPSLPRPRSPPAKPPAKLQAKPPVNLENRGPILPVPRGIRPTLSKYRIEVLFWGLRDLKRVQLQDVDKPRVDIECSGHTLTSTMIQNTYHNSNFNNPTKFIELELPDQGVYQPPLTIRVVDCRNFGRNVLVGTHTINSIQKYIFTPMSQRERDIEDRKKSMIQLQNVDLRANCIIQEDVFTITHERENMPLLPRGAPISFGLNRERSPRRTRSLGRGARGSRNRKASANSTLNEDDAHGSRDWWTKYFASYDVMFADTEDKTSKGGHLQTAPSTSGGLSPRSRDEPLSPARCDRECGGARRKVSQSPKGKVQSSIPTTKNNQIPKSSLTKVYPHELEAVPEYEEFKEWLHTFYLYRGKKTGSDIDDKSRIVGAIKGAIKVYKWPLPKGIDKSLTIMGHDLKNGFFQGVPSKDPIHVLVRIYIVKATDLHPMDMNGKADPYIVLDIGNKMISDKKNYVSKQLNPVFGKCYEIEAIFPQDSNLKISVFDWDLVGMDELIGETKIDLENRFYSRHRATCGLPQKYEETGYNRWRDSLKPTQILAKLCKDGKLEPPVYETTRVRIGRTVFMMPLNDEELFSNPDTHEEQMALVVLRRWEEVPRVGCHLVTEHVETRSLYNPNKPGIEQGRLEMWVDMFPMDVPPPGPPLDISPRKPKPYEMRVIIWNTDDVLLEDDAFFTGEKMSDIYVKGWVKGPDDCQSTDIHYRSLTGEGNFNWRFIYPFEYLEAEERIVTSRKESVFSWDETECKTPARLELQVWDADHFSSDDFLGALTLDLNRFPRGAKSAKHCTLQMLSNDGAVPTVNIFKQKRVRGWWPFYIKRDTEEMELTGKVEAEIHLLTREEADKLPAGLGRNEPEPLEKPNRPDASFMWFLNPLMSIRYIIWHNHKCKIIQYVSITFLCLGGIILLYSIPGYTVKKLLGA